MPVWGTADKLGPVMAQINQDTRFALHQCEMMMWLLDTLDCIEEFPPDGFIPYLKGGTCVQHYLPPEMQRFSLDLDFALDFENNIDLKARISAVREYLNRLNGQLLKNGWTSDHGGLKIPSVPRKNFSFICLCGRVFQPIKCPKITSEALEIKNAAHIKLEFFLHDNYPDYSKQNLALVSTKYAVKPIAFNVASKTRLLADKIVALSGEGYGARDENKDILDLEALSRLSELDLRAAAKMIIGWAESHLNRETGKPEAIDPPVKIVHAARNMAVTKSTISPKALAEMMGALYARGRSGFNLNATDWKNTCLEVESFLKTKIVPLLA